MDENFNRCFSDWIKRTEYTQGRCGSKPENSPSFIDHHESLLKKKKEKSQHMKYFKETKLSSSCVNYLLATIRSIAAQYYWQMK